MTNPWLTIITITKDDPKGIARTLESTTVFRTSGAEHLVMDGSAVAGLHLPPKENEHVRFVFCPPLGVSNAFNAGLAQARGDWVWFLNGGDTVCPGILPNELAESLSNSSADVIVGTLTYEGEACPRPHPPVELRWPPLRPWIPHPATLIRRDLFRRFGGYDERYLIAMDYEWWLRVLSDEVKVEVTDITLAIFAAGGISQRPEMRSRLIQEWDDIIRRHFGRLWRRRMGMAMRLRLMKARLRAVGTPRLTDGNRPIAPATKPL